MTLTISHAAKCIAAERIARIVEEPAWENRNRVEARAIAMVTARKIVDEIAFVFTARSAKQIAHATVEV